MLKMVRRRFKLLLSAVVVIIIYNFFGVSDYIYSRDFEQDFDYPLNIDIKPLVKEALLGRKPSVQPINLYPYKFLTNSGKCKTLEKLDLLIAVKSAMGNFGYRLAIRETYGQENAVAGRIIKTVFFIGSDGKIGSNIQAKISKEMSKHRDLIQMDFTDNYFNNTIKTMMMFRWAYQHCSTADYYLFTDDDMYISVPNLLNYVQDLLPLEKDVSVNNKLYAGYVFESSPLRLMSSKWRVSLEEYPWNKWPRYVTAGAYVLSNQAMKEMYLGSLFVKHFRFDDIYLGIVAKKVGIKPVNCPQFYYYKKEYSKKGYRNVIASHGFDDHEELVNAWNEQHRII